MEGNIADLFIKCIASYKFQRYSGDIRWTGSFIVITAIRQNIYGLFGFKIRIEMCYKGPYSMMRDVSYVLFSSEVIFEY